MLTTVLLKSSQLLLHTNKSKSFKMKPILIGGPKNSLQLPTIAKCRACLAQILLLLSAAIVPNRVFLANRNTNKNVIFTPKSRRSNKELKILLQRETVTTTQTAFHQTTIFPTTGPDRPNSLPNNGMLFVGLEKLFKKPHKQGPKITYPGSRATSSHISMFFAQSVSFSLSLVAVFTISAAISPTNAKLILKAESKIPRLARSKQKPNPQAKMHCFLQKPQSTYI